MKMDLVLNNQQLLIHYKAKPNQTKHFYYACYLFGTKLSISSVSLLLVMCLVHFNFYYHIISMMSFTIHLFSCLILLALS